MKRVRSTAAFFSSKQIKSEENHDAPIKLKGTNNRKLKMSSDHLHSRHIFHSNRNRAHFFDHFLTESLLAATHAWICIICLERHFIEINFSVDFVGRWNFSCLPKCTILMLAWWWLTMWNRKKAFSTCKYDIIEYALVTMEHLSLFGKSQHFHDNKIASFAYFFW